MENSNMMLIIKRAYAVHPFFIIQHFFQYKFMDIYSFNWANMLINGKHISLPQTSASEPYIQVSLDLSLFMLQGIFNLICLIELHKYDHAIHLDKVLQNFVLKPLG